MADDDGRVHRAVQGGRLIEVQREVEKHLGVELGATGVWPLVEGHVYSADMVERPKPAPDLFLHAARS